MKKKTKSGTCNFQVRILEMVFIEFRLGSILEDFPPTLYEDEEECELFLSLTISLKLFFLNYYIISHQFGGDGADFNHESSFSLLCNEEIDWKLKLWWWLNTRPLPNSWACFLCVQFFHIFYAL